MITGLRKVETPLSERYITVCASCRWDKQFFGTATEARESALRMGWEFRRIAGPLDGEHAYCPHCKILVPATTGGL